MTFVIAGPHDEEDGTLYWSDEDGWVHRSTATIFPDTTGSLPFDITARWEAAHAA